MIWFWLWTLKEIKCKMRHYAMQECIGDGLDLAAEALRVDRTGEASSMPKQARSLESTEARIESKS